MLPAHNSHIQSTSKPERIFGSSTGHSEFTYRKNINFSLIQNVRSQHGKNKSSKPDFIPPIPFVPENDK
jgi:hypothetical protein